MARRAPALITSSNAKRWLEGFDNCLIDCDGVLWKGEEKVEGAAAALEALATKHNKSLYFVTNNASKSRLDLIDKLAKFGIFNIRESQVSRRSLPLSLSTASVYSFKAK
jgi:ribonucleotide monophosphatase NagD (HAD superfamily)